MQDRELSVDLNLLPLLSALLRERSVTQAARSLGVSQPAASQGLARLRNALGDTLLVRVGSRMELTPRGVALAERIDALSTELAAIFALEDFVAATSTRTFVIAAGDYSAFFAARPLLDMQRRKAPGVRLKFIEIGPDFARRMAAREIDIALLPQFAVMEFTTAPLRFRALGRDVLAVVMDPAHPLANRSVIAEEDLARYEHVTLRVDALEQDTLERAERIPELAALERIIRRVAVQTNHMMLVPSLLKGTEFVSMIPLQMALALSEEHSLAVHPLGYGPGLQMGMAWSPVFDDDTAHRWLRNELSKLALWPQVNA